MVRATLATLFAAALIAGATTSGAASAGELSIRFGGHGGRAVQGYAFRYGGHGGIRNGRGVRRHRGNRPRARRRHRTRLRYIYRFPSTTHITVIRPPVIYQSTRWLLPRGTVRNVLTVPGPVPEPAAVDRRYCREYQRTVMIDGAAIAAFGTACRQADGSWRIIAAE